jgi:hypothetical protein
MVVVIYRTQSGLYILKGIRKKGEIIMNNSQVNITPEKFQSAEQIWFWFLYSKSVRNDIGQYRGNAATRRVCELVDVETMITKLYLAGKLNDEQLSVIKEFGDRRRAPHQYIWRENHAAAVWDSAMRVIDAAARAKGWIE